MTAQIPTPAAPSAPASSGLPLAKINWWIGLAITLGGMALASAQATLTDYAKEHPQDTTIALVLVGLGLATKWLAAHHDVALKKIQTLFPLLLILPLLGGCVSGQIKTGIAQQHRDLVTFIGASQPAVGVDLKAWKDAASALARESADLDVAANGPAAPTATAN